MAATTLYNLCYKLDDALISPYLYQLALNGTAIDKFIAAYKLGSPSVFIRGSTIKFSPIREIRIYDNSKLPEPKNNLDDIDAEFANLNKAHDTLFGTHYDRVFRKMGHELTDQFIQGEWGYCKGKIILNHHAILNSVKGPDKKPSPIPLQKFNIYIKYRASENKKPVYRIATHKTEVMKLQKAYADGQSIVVLDGARTPIQGFTRIKIFKVAGKYNNLSKEELRLKLRVRARDTISGQLSEAILSEFGSDVTSEYIQGEFGEHNAAILPAVQVKANGFRAQLGTVTNQRTKDFVDEAISCYSNSNYRAAVVLSWVGAISLLYDYVILHHLAPFNTEAHRVNPKWKNATTIDDLTNMKEHSFIQILSAVGVIGKNLRQELEHCLQLRNSCGHPNSLVVGELRAAGHIETLILNVYTKFQ